MAQRARGGSRAAPSVNRSGRQPRNDRKRSPTPHTLSPTGVIDLQRSAGNQAVAGVLTAGAKDSSAGPGGVLQRAPETVSAKAKLDAMLLVLRSASARAYYERAELEGDKQAKPGARYGLAVKEISADVDEALMLSEQRVGGDAVFKAATTLFGTAIPMIKLGNAKRYSGGITVQKKLSALNLSLQKQGYKFPIEQIEAGGFAAPKELENPELLRVAGVLLMAARAEIQGGVTKLATERKAGHTPTELYGASAATVHVRDAHRLMTDLSSPASAQFDTLRLDVIATSDLALGLLRQGAALAGARTLWDEINAINGYIGLPAVMPFGTPTATDRPQAASERLTEMDKERVAAESSGKAWTQEQTKAQLGAEHEAVAAATEALGKARHKDAAPLDVGAVLDRINADITRIEIARSAGYTAAVAFLATRALDTPSNIKSFSLALFGNLAWALSSFIPAVGLLREGSRVATALGGVAKADAEVGAMVGVAGAMIAQFSGGLPSEGAGDVSGTLDKLQEALNKTNSVLANSRRAQSYVLLSDLMSKAPPSADEDAESYLEEAEAGLRHRLYGEVFEKKLNNNYQPDHAKVMEEAKRQMLAAASGPYVDVTDKGKLDVSTPGLDSDFAKKMAKAGSESSSLTFDQFELVASRVTVAAREMGCSVAFDSVALNAALARGETVELPVSRWSWREAALTQRTGSFTRWEDLVRDKRIQTNPEITLAFALDEASMSSIDSITVTAADLSRRTFHGKEIFTLDRVSFAAVGGGHFSQYMYSGSKSPDRFKVIYSFKEA